MVDLDERKVVAVEGFAGEISPEEISENKKEAFGKAPWNEIEEFLLGLPQR